jgi:tetratricopeptide (TPR) repeat protein
LLLAESSYDQAIREYSAVLALNPLDKAGAEFNLAQAYFAAGKRDQAEETVLLALERAPGFRPAQKLLLEINQDSKHADNPTREGITTDVHPR